MNIQSLFADATSFQAPRPADHLQTRSPRTRGERTRVVACSCSETGARRASNAYKQFRSTTHLGTPGWF